MKKSGQAGSVSAEIAFIKNAIGQAQRLHYQNRFDESALLCKEVLTRVPEHVTALHIQVMNLRARGEYRLAEEVLVRLSRVTDKNNDDVLYEWGALHAQKGNFATAIDYLDRVIALNHRHANAHMVLGRMYDRVGQLGKAETLLRRAHDLRPADETICKDLAGVYARQGLRQMAMHYAKMAYNLNPRYIDGLIYWASLCEHEGQFDKGFSLLAAAREIAPENPLITCQEGILHRRRKAFDKALACFDAIDPAQFNSFAKSSYYKQKGLTLERLERYDEAFDCFTAMAQTNNAPPLNFSYPAEEYGRQFDEVQAFWDKQNAGSLPHLSIAEPLARPIFIAGFPRSGTTLLEQILGSHSAVLPGGETHAVEGAIGLLGKLDNFSAIHRAIESKPAEALQQFQKSFYAALSKGAVLEPGYRFFTEKTPLNETYLGLIHHALGAASVIHMIRHPLNVVMSAFFNEVRHARNCAATLQSAALHYSRVMDLVALYQERFEMNYLPVRYEDLVADHEGKTKEILDFLGLEWEDACAQFDKNKRTVRTPSYEQVSEKIYTRSLERYKPFLKHLEPIIPILEPYIEKYGYSIDD
jgi:tetratricopeptide (TPR) repeat protein